MGKPRPVKVITTDAMAKMNVNIDDLSKEWQTAIYDAALSYFPPKGEALTDRAEKAMARAARDMYRSLKVAASTEVQDD